MTRFAIGDVVWTPHASGTEKTRPCRICAGKRCVVLTLGSGECVEIECGYCQAGFESPRGFETYQDYAPSASSYRVTGIESYRDAHGEHMCYRSGSDGCYRILKDADCYVTAEEATAAAGRVIAEREAEQEQRMSQKDHARRTYAWNAGYHLREAERARLDLAHHERKAVLLQAKVTK
jgi:hypothetical protein